jgi:hypothetical protein
MIEETYKLTAEDLTHIRNALRHRIIGVDVKSAIELRELRDRFFGTKAVVITYPRDGE